MISIWNYFSATHSVYFYQVYILKIDPDDKKLSYILIMLGTIDSTHFTIQVF